VGVLAHEDVGINFTGTDFSWMESWIWIGALAAIFIVFWLVDRPGANELVRPGGRPTEQGRRYVLLCAAVGALLFAASLASGHDTAWPGVIAGAVAAFIGYLGLAQFFIRANSRLEAAGDPGVVLGLGRDLVTIALTVLVVVADVVGYVVLVAALVLAATARRRAGEKYEGLRVLR
jgi:hypothetical protein